MNRYFEAHGLMNVEPYTQISELSSSRRALTLTRPFPRLLGLSLRNALTWLRCQLCVSDVPSNSCDE